MNDVKYYSQKEEQLNIWSHGIGAALSFIGSVLLILESTRFESFAVTVSVGAYGLCMVTLYLASTCYHAAKEPNRRARLRVFDHAAIYLLIAGTYTPFAVVSLHESSGPQILVTVWSSALIGILLKLKFTGRYNLLSTALYVMMGWVAVFYYRSIVEALSVEVIWLLLAGGIAYTSGAILYLLKLPFNHAIFHFAVLIGSGFHYFSIYLSLN